MESELIEKQTHTHINTKILPLALPMAGTQLITTASTFVCMALLAKLGHDVLAASALIFATQISIMVVGMSILLALSILVGHAYGAKNYLEIGNFIQLGWTLSLLISIPIMIIFWNIGDILSFAKQPPTTVKLVQDFFHVYIFSVIPWLFGVCNQQLCYGVRKQSLDIITNAMGVIILLGTAYVLIFGKFNLPVLGVKGLAIAMSAQVWFYFLFTTVCFYFGKFFKDFKLFRYRAYKDWNRLLYMLKIGWPICLQISTEVLSLFIMSIMVGWLGTNALAAFQVINQYLVLITIPIFALSQACGVVVGQACGAKQFNEIKRLGYSGISITSIISLTIGAVFITFPQNLASIYIDINNPANTPVIQMIGLLFVVVAFSQFFDAIRNVLTGALRGLLDTRFPMIIAIIAIWIIGIPSGYLLAFILNFGVVGIVIGPAVGLFLSALIMLLRWNQLTKKYQPSEK
jgi:MATE family multidrug resistance protein